MRKTFIAGPCVIESAELLDTVAAKLVEINKKLAAEGDVSVEDWYDFLDIPYPIRDLFEVWCIECLLDRGETWVNFIYDYEEDKEHGLYFTVMPEQWPCDAYWECKGGCD